MLISRFMATLLFTVGVITLSFWTYERESLYIHLPKENPQIDLCIDGEFYTERVVINTKEIDAFGKTWFVDELTGVSKIISENEFRLKVTSDEGNSVLFYRKIPNDLPKGLYSYYGQVDYKLNPIRNITFFSNTSYVFVACGEDGLYEDAYWIISDDTLSMETKIKRLVNLTREYREGLLTK